MPVLFQHVSADDPDAARTKSPRQRRTASRTDAEGLGQGRAVLGIGQAKHGLHGGWRRHRVPLAPLLHLGDCAQGLWKMLAPLWRHLLFADPLAGTTPLPCAREDPEALRARLDDRLVPDRVGMQCPHRTIHQDQIVRRQDAATVVARPQPYAVKQRVVDPWQKPCGRPESKHDCVGSQFADATLDLGDVVQEAVDPEGHGSLAPLAAACAFRTDESGPADAAGLTFSPAERIFTTSSSALSSSAARSAASGILSRRS